jgi:hypothetical protein
MVRKFEGWNVVCFFLSRKAQIFFPGFNIRLYDKNSESDYFFFDWDQLSNSNILQCMNRFLPDSTVCWPIVFSHSTNYRSLVNVNISPSFKSVARQMDSDRKLETVPYNAVFMLFFSRVYLYPVTPFTFSVPFTDCYM